MTQYFSLWVGNNVSHLELATAFSNTQVLGRDRYRVFLYPQFSDHSLFEVFKALDISVEDANAIVPHGAVFRNPDRPSFAGFSNVFRYQALIELSRYEPAVWLDLDYVLTNETEWSDVLLGLESRRWVNGAILGVAGGYGRTFAHKLLDEAKTVAPDAVVWGSLGPRLITSTLHRSFPSLLSQLKPQAVLYPLRYHQAADYWEPSSGRMVRRRIAQAAGFHLWNEALRDEPNGPRFTRPIPGAFMAEFFDQLQVVGLPETCLPERELPRETLKVIRRKTRRKYLAIARGLLNDRRSGELPPSQRRSV